MLQTLRIRNLALIDEVELEFGSGFNVLTGETGAGKSIVVGALGLVLGARASAEHVHESSSEARVDAMFRLPRISPKLERLLEEHGIALEAGELLLSRVVSKQGRSRAYAGGGLVALSVLSAIGDELIDLHGQHEHQSLLKPARQLELIDSFGGLLGEVEALGALVVLFKELSAKVVALEEDDRERTRQIEFRRFEVNEIDKAGLSAGEEVALRSRRNLLMNSEKIFALVTSAYEKLFSSEAERAAVDAIDSAAGDLKELGDIDSGFEPLGQQLTSVRAELEAVVEELRGHSEGLSFEPGELDELNGRLSVIADLARKYGDTTADILAYRDKARVEIEEFEQRDVRLAELRERREAAKADADAAATKLSAKRQRVAKKLDKQISSSIRTLAMAGGGFRARFEEGPLGLRGRDRLEFMLSANEGESEKPLRQVASGGEMSRLMLALKAAFAEADEIPTLVFDEIDAGVGGAVATRVGEKLSALSRSHQVICVTHLPQIAAVADRHFNVSKATKGGRTTTRVDLVDEASRVGELARLLDGTATEVSLKHAEELLKNRAS